MNIWVNDTGGRDTCWVICIAPTVYGFPSREAAEDYLRRSHLSGRVHEGSEKPREINKMVQNKIIKR